MKFTKQFFVAFGFIVILSVMIETLVFLFVYLTYQPRENESGSVNKYVEATKDLGSGQLKGGYLQEEIKEDSSNAGIYPKSNIIDIKFNVGIEKPVPSITYNR